MPYNGNGTFTPFYNWTNDKNNGLKIRSDRHDTQDTDLATGLSTALTKDGQTVAAANLPMGGFRHLNCADAVNTDEYATLGQLTNMASAAGAYGNNTVAASGSSQALDFATYQSYFITLTAACTITITGNPTSGSNLNERIIVVLQDNTGGWALTWPASIKWTGTISPSTPPTLGTSANTYALIRLKTINSGTTWVGSVEGTGGQGGGNIPVAALYFIGGQGMKANKSNDGATFTASTPSFNTTANVISALYNPVYSKFVILGLSPSSNETAAHYIQTSTDGSSWTSPTGSSNTMDATSYNTLYQFSNGNMVTGQGCNNTNAAAFSGDGGATWSGIGDVSHSLGVPLVSNGWCGTANSAIIARDASGITVYTTDSAVTLNQITHTGVTDAKANIYLNGNYIFGGATGNIGYKTLISSTTLTTITSNLASANFKGGVYTGTTYVLFTATSLSTATSMGGTWTSRTTAFFTTASMTGNIVAMAVNAGQTVVMGVTDTGDVARSTDGGVTWSKLSVANNPLAGSQIRGIKYAESNFWIFGDTGKIAYSIDGVTFTSITTTGFSSNAILTFAAS